MTMAWMCSSGRHHDWRCMYLNSRSERCQSPRRENSRYTAAKSCSVSRCRAVSRHRAIEPRGGRLLSRSISDSTSYELLPPPAAAGTTSSLLAAAAAAPARSSTASLVPAPWLLLGPRQLLLAVGEWRRSQW
uniref:Uncharacterized protein n=1 Tax=Arundo donax TaxID=35708 RepID=A0A0A9DM26_ARUDO